MQVFDITILGSNSAIPANGRHPSSQLINIGSKYAMVDCGEGTQMRLSQVKAKPFKIEHIFISHLHGDHFLGVFGLLTSLSLMGRTKPLNLYAHTGLKEIIDIQLEYSGSVLGFPLHFHKINENQTGLLVDTPTYDVFTFPLRHRIATNGFLFKEKVAKPNLNVERMEKLSIPRKHWSLIQKGEDFISESGEVYKNETLIEANKSMRSYAYCSDTVYNPKLVAHIKNASLAYIESTYLNDMEAQAKERYHCTAKQAATLARDASIPRLLIGHFSSNYKDLQPFLTEAKAVFENVELAIEGEVFSV